MAARSTGFSPTYPALHRASCAAIPTSSGCGVRTTWQTSPLKLRFQLPERYLARVKRGQSVRATVDPYPGQTFAGKVTVIGGVVDPQTRTVAVETEFSNADGRLSPGLFARVEIDLGPVVEG